jgi:2-polyprenyl-6-methoxyphenol hydroxylase-like FAD-dependent oxidoreductase
MYDVIVVGARCAGSPTAMLLARKGYRVLLVDQAGFPSDTLSTHYIHQPGVARLKRWGLLDSVADSNCPPVSSSTGPLLTSTRSALTSRATSSRRSTSPPGSRNGHAPVDAASASGARPICATSSAVRMDPAGR